MSYPLIGALVGLASAIAEFFMSSILIGRANILDMIRKAQIVIFPAAGWIVGSLYG